MSRLNEEKKELISLKYPVHNLAYNNISKKLFRSTNLSNSSRYKSNSSANFSNINKSQKLINNNKYTTTNSKNNQNVNNSNLNKKDEIQNYENNNKKLSFINTTSRKFISSNRSDINKAHKGNKDIKDNCSFYISNSSNLKSDNKNNLKTNKKSLNYSNYTPNSQREFTMNHQNKGYKSKTLLINPDEYLKKDLEKDFKTKYINLTDNKFVYSNRSNTNTSQNTKNDKIYQLVS